MKLAIPALAAAALLVAVANPAAAGPTVKKRTWLTHAMVLPAQAFGWGSYGGAEFMPDITCPEGDAPLLVAARAIPSRGWIRSGNGATSNPTLLDRLVGWELRIPHDALEGGYTVLRGTGKGAAEAELPAGLRVHTGNARRTLVVAATVSAVEATSYDLTIELTFACGDFPVAAP